MNMLWKEYLKPHPLILIGASLLCGDGTSSLSCLLLRPAFACPSPGCVIVYSPPRRAPGSISRWLCRSVLLEANSPAVLASNNSGPSENGRRRRRRSIRAGAWRGEGTSSAGPTSPWSSDDCDSLSAAFLCSLVKVVSWIYELVVAGRRWVELLREVGGEWGRYRRSYLVEDCLSGWWYVNVGWDSNYSLMLSSQI